MYLGFRTNVNEWLAVEWFFHVLSILKQSEGFEVPYNNTPLWLLYVTFSGTLIDHDNLLTAFN